MSWKSTGGTPNPDAVGLGKPVHRGGYSQVETWQVSRGQPGKDLGKEYSRRKVEMYESPKPKTYFYKTNSVKWVWGQYH